MALAGNRPDWLMIDHYAIGAEWQRMVRPCCGRILVIDDLANRPHDCDILLDQNHTGQSGPRYGGLVPPQCRQLLGPRYALLKREYATFRQTMPPRDGAVRRVLIFFGGVDHGNATGLSLEALSGSEFRDIAVDLVVGATTRTEKPSRSRLRRARTR